MYTLDCRDYMDYGYFGPCGLWIQWIIGIMYTVDCVDYVEYEYFRPCGLCGLWT